MSITLIFQGITELYSAFEIRGARQRWVEWLFEARKRYGLSILNYVKDVKDGLIGRVRGRQAVEREGTFELREQQVAYHCTMRNDWNPVEWDE